MNSKSSKNAEKIFSSDHVGNTITEFKYEPAEGVIFGVYYRRYKEIFSKEYRDWDNVIKAHLILSKLAAEHKHYSN